MNEMPPTFSTGTWQAWTRLPRYVRLLCALVVAIAVVALATSAIRTPAIQTAAIAPAAGNAAVTAETMPDTSVPDASRALSTGDRPQEVSTPTF
jgi:hypothetical protein